MTTEIEPVGEHLEAGDDGADLFLRHLEEADKRPEKAAEAPEESPAEESTEEPSEAPVEASEDAEDDAEVELPFDSETKKFKLSEVKAALAAREAHEARAAEAQKALTEAAEQSSHARAALEKVISKAKERYAPYENVDWLSLSRDPSIPFETFQAAREEAQAAFNDLKFYTEELGAETARTQQAQQAAHQEAAKACLKELEDPSKGIKGFGPQLYNQMMSFAASQGMPDMVRVTSPAALKTLHMAMLYSQGQAKAQAQVTKVVKQPTKVIRPAGSKTDTGSSKITSAMAALRSSGSLDAATAAFAAHLNG